MVPFLLLRLQNQAHSLYTGCSTRNVESSKGISRVWMVGDKMGGTAAIAPYIFGIPEDRFCKRLPMDDWEDDIATFS